MKEDYFCLFI